MSKTKRSFLVAAAITGLLTAGAIKSYGDDSTDSGKNASTNSIDKASCKGKAGCKTQDSCKGKNDCKGKGNCKTGDNSCKGQNSCKGKGGCKAA